MLSTSIFEVAGPDIQSQCKLHYPNGIQVNQIAVTTGGQISDVKFIYHLTCPNYSTDSKNVTIIKFINLRQ